MGKSQFIKRAVSLFLVLCVTLLAVGFFKKSGWLNAKRTINDKNISSALISSFEENKTLDKRYQTVAAEIEAFIKKQKIRQKIRTSDINKSVKVVKKSKLVYKKHSSSLPKLAIIMDDVGFYNDIEKIKKLPFAITPSIFPPSDNYPDTSQIAKKIKHYMVHLPMEAYRYKNINEDAIKVSDKIEVIDKKIRLMNKNFPNAIAINNHTGSKYTCDYDAMEEFFTVLNRYNIDFIDSRTSSGTQCKKVGKLLNKKVLERDIFLDNRADVDYIKNQLKKAVEIAKENGQAIAICHPRELTFEVLSTCKSLLKGVELVYVNELL